MTLKLIEVALPLEAINREATRESYIYKGNPSSLHKWWAQKPLTACRAVLFAQMVDDPSANPARFPTEADQTRERARLFSIIERLAVWESASDERLLQEARDEIRRSCGGDPPPLLDPFCGGGSIPLEAQRLGLAAHGADLNPVAVLITKGLIDLPVRFAGRPPVRPDPEQQDQMTTWTAAQGLTEDVRYYGDWIRDAAARELEDMYPGVSLPDGTVARTIAWLWVRTITCPNPVCRGSMPLASSFWLSRKKDRAVWADPVPEAEEKRVRFSIAADEGGNPPPGTIGRTGAVCILCSTPVPLSYVRNEGRAGRMQTQLMAIAAEQNGRRVYFPPSTDHIDAAAVPRPVDVPDAELPANPRDFKTPNYGMTHHADLFTNRQLKTLSTLAGLVSRVRDKVIEDKGTSEYADAVATYLAFAVSKLADYGCSLVPWYAQEDRPSHLFTKQAIPMVWNFAELNPLAQVGGALDASLRIVADAIPNVPEAPQGTVVQADAAVDAGRYPDAVISTDPPYYDNVGFAGLSDFFYVWLRRSLQLVYPRLFDTVLTPKREELVASPYRFDGDKRAAEHFFEEGFHQVFWLFRSERGERVADSG